MFITGHIQTAQWGRSLCAVLSLPLPERKPIAKVFISQAIEISENYQIDTEIRQGAGTVTVIFSFDCGGAMGFLKSVIQYADDISFFSSTNGYEIVLALDFYTYALYRHGRKMRPWLFWPVHCAGFLGFLLLCSNPRTWNLFWIFGRMNCVCGAFDV